MTSQWNFVDRPSVESPQIEPTLPLINIVFLLLVFFMIAGSFRAPLDNEINVPKQKLEVGGIEFDPSDWLYIDAAGELSFRQYALSLDHLGRAIKQGQVVLYADGGLPGRDLTITLYELERAGAESVMLITEQSKTP